jgi:hypothetical protein
MPGRKKVYWFDDYGTSQGGWQESANSGSAPPPGVRLSLDEEIALAAVEAAIRDTDTA